VELYHMASGEKRWVQTDKVPYRDSQGHVIGVLVFAQDITERKRAEAALQESEHQYRLLMEEASDGIVVLDRDGYYRMANSKACDLLGRTKEELLQLHVRDTYVSSEKPIAQQRLEQLRSEKDLRFNRLLQRKDGTVISVEISATKMSDDRFLGILRDLSRQKLSP
jgi:PAS domain S-box-containing protein